MPKALRDRIGLETGRRVSLSEHNGAIVMRAVDEPRKSGLTAEEIFARIAARNTYRGPYVSDDDIREAVQETAFENDEATKWNRDPAD